MLKSTNSNLIANKRIARNSLFMSVRMVIVLGISLYTTRTVLAILGVEDYGVFNVVCGFVSMFAFLNTSLSNGIQRYYNYELAKNGVAGARKVYNTSLLIQTFLSIILVLIIESVGIWYISNRMVITDGRLFAAQSTFQFAIISLVITVMQAPYVAAVMAHEKMDFYAIVCIIDAVLKLFIVFALPVIGGDHLIWYGFLWMLISLFNWLCYFFYSKKYFTEIQLHKTNERNLLKSLLGFSGWNLFGSVSGILREQGLNLIMNFFFGPVVNAAKGIATQVNSGLQGFVQNITTPVRPQVIQSYAQGDLGRTMNLTYSISKLTCYFITMMAIPICFEINTVLRIWLGYNIPEHAITFVIIIIMTSYQGNLNSAISTVVYATGKMKNYQFWGSIVKMMSVPIGYILLKYGMQPEYALLSVFIFDWAGHFTGLFILRSLIDFSIKDYIIKVMTPILFVTILSGLIIYPLHYFIYNDLARLLVVILASILVVCLSMYYLGLKKSERELVKNIGKSLKNKIIK